MTTSRTSRLIVAIGLIFLCVAISMAGQGAHADHRVTEGYVLFGAAAALLGWAVLIIARTPQ